MKRTPLKRGKPLARGGSPARRTRLRFRSKKTAEVYRTQRVPLVKATLAGEPLCQLILPGCTGLADSVHEVKPRGRGGSITNPANVLPACVSCNTGASQQHITEAQDRGLLAHSWDDEGGRSAAPDGGDTDAA